MFIKNIWYVAAWASELDETMPLGKVIIGEPVMFWRDASGNLIAQEDRCPHRHAALSMGRVEGDQIRCMYHGLKFSSSGECTHVPGSDIIPPNCSLQTYPVAEKYNWIWVWMGDPEKADEALIPDCFADEKHYRSPKGKLVYNANYELINDNLTDLSHLDFVHETSLGGLTGYHWATELPEISQIENGLLLQRWMRQPLNPEAGEMPDSWNRYRYMLPGIFLQEVKLYPHGTAQQCDYGVPPDDITPFMDRIDQQAVTPISETQTQYLFCVGATKDSVESEEAVSDLTVVNTAFAEDKAMIEGQQRIWNLTSESQKKAFIHHDKAPALLRRMILKRLEQEAQDE